MVIKTTTTTEFQPEIVFFLWCSSALAKYMARVNIETFPICTFTVQIDKQASIYVSIKGIAKKSSCFISVQSRFWHMNICPWNWHLLSSKVVHSPIKCDCFFQHSSCCQQWKSSSSSYTQVFVDPTLGRIAVTSRKRNYNVSHDLTRMITCVTIFRPFVIEYSAFE